MVIAAKIINDPAICFNLALTIIICLLSRSTRIFAAAASATAAAAADFDPFLSMIMIIADA